MQQATQNTQTETIQWLEQETRRLEQEIHQQYYEMGKTIYDMLDRKMHEIGSTVDRLVEVKQTLVRLKTQCVCQSNTEQQRLQGQYCPGCGGIVTEYRQEEVQ